METKVYVVNDNKKILEFDNWDKCKTYIEEHPDARCKKCTSEEEKQAFIERSNKYIETASKKKVYVAIVDNKSYKFDSWKECEAFVSNKKNSIYKSFTDAAAAQEFISCNIKRVIPFDLPDVLYGYVDGSVRRDVIKTPIYSYGVCMVKNKKVVHEEGTAFADENSTMHQVYGELLGAIRAVEYAISKGESRVILVYDFMGIEMWYNGSWKVGNEAVKEYVDTMKKYSEYINIDFIHVNSHIPEGQKKMENRFNDRADELANEAINEYIRKNLMYRS